LVLRWINTSKTIDLRFYSEINCRRTSDRSYRPTNSSKKVGTPSIMRLHLQDKSSIKPNRKKSRTCLRWTLRFIGL
jgi:hypothetical protein